MSHWPWMHQVWQSNRYYSLGYAWCTFKEVTRHRRQVSMRRICRSTLGSEMYFIPEKWNFRGRENLFCLSLTWKTTHRLEYECIRLLFFYRGFNYRQPCTQWISCFMVSYGIRKKEWLIHPQRHEKEEKKEERVALKRRQGDNKMTWAILSFDCHLEYFAWHVYTKYTQNDITRSIC